ncbi:MAG: penicillin-insensitive murein endopeptidase [Succinivibrio sp.]
MAALLFWQSADTAEVIGEYANGCIADAIALHDGDHYQVQVWGKNRNYGHETLISYLHDLVKRAKQNSLPDLLIGDLSGPLGGSFGKNSNHGSHQTGLDVDIPFDFASPRKSSYELSHPKDIYIVDTHNRPTEFFDENRKKLIYLAASDSRVERIFVAPGIKAVMCSLDYKDRSYLSKLRPWFGHRAHMHIRLACPSGSPLCVKQKAVPEGDGCGMELDSWLHPEKYAGSSGGNKRIRKPKVMHPECVKLFQAKKIKQDR